MEEKVKTLDEYFMELTERFDRTLVRLFQELDTRLNENWGNTPEAKLILDSEPPYAPFEEVLKTIQRRQS